MRTKPAHLLLSLLLCSLMQAAQGAGLGVPDDIVLIRSSDAPAYQRASQHLQLQLKALSNPSIHELNLQPKGNKTRPSPKLTHVNRVVSVGSKACHYAAKHALNADILCGFITANSFASIKRQFHQHKSLSAIYIDQPLHRLLNLASLMKQEQDIYSVGLLSQNSRANQSIIETAEAKHPKLNIETAELLINDNPVKVIEPLILNSDVLIVQPSAKLFNRLVAKVILQLSLRYKVPIIGFSQKYTEAGALVSLFSSPEDVGQDVADEVARQLKHSTTNTTRHGRHFSISVNDNVARKLQAAIDSDTLEQQLTAMENNNPSHLDDASQKNAED